MDSDVQISMMDGKWYLGDSIVPSSLDDEGWVWVEAPPRFVSQVLFGSPDTESSEFDHVSQAEMWASDSESSVYHDCNDQQRHQELEEIADIDTTPLLSPDSPDSPDSPCPTDSPDMSWEVMMRTADGDMVVVSMDAECFEMWDLSPVPPQSPSPT